MLQAISNIILLNCQTQKKPLLEWNAPLFDASCLYKKKVNAKKETTSVQNDGC